MIKNCYYDKYNKILIVSPGTLTEDTKNKISKEFSEIKIVEKEIKEAYKIPTLKRKKNKDRKKNKKTNYKNKK